MPMCVPCEQAFAGLRRDIELVTVTLPTVLGCWLNRDPFCIRVRRAHGVEDVRHHFHAMQVNVEMVEAVVGLPTRHICMIRHVHVLSLHVRLSCTVRKGVNLIVGAQRTDHHPRPSLYPIVDFLRIILPRWHISLLLVVWVERILHHQIDRLPRQHLQRWSQEPLRAIATEGVRAERRVGGAFHRLDMACEERDVLIRDRVRLVDVRVCPRRRCFDQLGVFDLETPQLSLQVIVCIPAGALRRIAIGNVAGALHGGVWNMFLERLRVRVPREL
mmetsp:Transcript_62852/g.159115  ORF Transcript_62852/g.159115 Transcript_62852/m.159115 type:complete len:273 (+) Transcript_62852:800-1618(+)